MNAACSHLLHMPTHLDIQVGAYGPAMLWNVIAYKADQRIMAQSPRQRVWPGYVSDVAAHPPLSPTYVPHCGAVIINN